MPRLERTQDQILVTTGIDGVLSKATPWNWAKKVRAMRYDPTIGFVRDLFLAPLLSSAWSVVSDKPEYKSAEQDLLDNFLPIRTPFLRNAHRGLLDFGWQAFETVWEYRRETGRLGLKKMKPLLQDISDILVNEYGEIRGVRNRPTYLSSILPHSYREGPWIDLNHDECFITNRDVEGTNWYGDAMMRRAEGPYDSWLECEKAARRFDTKIAGAHWVVYYPIGYSRYKGDDEVDNFTIAEDILKSMEASGKIAVPMKVAQQIDELNQDIGENKRPWQIELMSVSGTSESAFVGRQKYLDALKARALDFPERAILEGNYGTKAEAEAHADFAIDNIEMFQVDLMDQLNDWPVRFLLTVNHGEEFVGKVRLVATPISDEKKRFLRTLYMSYLGTQTGGSEEAEAVDWDAARDELGIPARQDYGGTPGLAPGASPDATDGDPGVSGQEDPANAAAAALGEYTLIGQRAFSNNLKRIRGILDEVRGGTMSRVLAEQTLAAIGVPAQRSSTLLDDAQAGEVDDPDEIGAPLVTGGEPAMNGHAHV